MLLGKIELPLYLREKKEFTDDNKEGVHWGSGVTKQPHLPIYITVFIGTARA